MVVQSGFKLKSTVYDQSSLQQAVNYSAGKDDVFAK